MNSNILFISPKFYNYHHLICKKLSKYGNVIFFSEKIPNFLFSFFNTFMPWSIDFLQKIYFYIILFKLRKRLTITHLFVIRGYKLPIFFLERLRKRFPNVKMVMYQWDSINNNNYMDLVPFFDKVFTFDYVDSIENNNLTFLQLFYTDEIKVLRESSIKNCCRYDLLCVCSFSPARYELVNQLNTNDQLSVKLIIYIPYSTYLKFKYLNGIRLDKKLLTFKPIDKKQYLNLLEESHVIIDFSHVSQSGLSMRVIEGLGAGKKIITTNKHSLTNPIYSKGYLLYKDIEEIKNLTRDQIKNFDSTDQHIFEEFHIDKWLEKIIL